MSESGEDIEESVVELGEPPKKIHKSADVSPSEPNLNNLLVDLTHNDDDTPRPENPKSAIISIKFDCLLTGIEYQDKFLTFLRNFPEFEVRKTDGITLEVFKTDEFTDSPKGKKRKKRSKVKKELFVLDATPSPNVASFNLQYTAKFTLADKGPEPVKQPSRLGCFNCSEFHALRDCPHPKDFAKINAARAARGKGQPKSLRYHLEEDQRFSHLKPGKLSDTLRKALGLHRNETPAYIYGMRELGYPPGWLEEAKVQHSDLKMFGIDAKRSKNKPLKKSGLDETKIVDYAGFNVPFGKGAKDEYRKYGVPPFSQEYSKEAMLTFFEQNYANVEDEMEISDEDRADDSPLQEETDIIDLEQQKREILDELNEEPTVDVSTSNYMTVKTSCFGTPVLKTGSSYSSLPNQDNFMKGVSPVINFENLPNSTGKYEQMTDVLQKVRSTMKSMDSSGT